MEFLLYIFGPVKSFGEATEKWIGYINNLDANMTNLKRKMDDLSSQEDDINNKLNCAEQRSRKRRKKVVDVRLRDVQMLKVDVQTLYTQEKIVGWMDGCLLSARLGKVFTEKIQELKKLQENGSFSNGLLIEDSTSGQFIPTTGSFGETTSARNKEKVWNCLMDDEVRGIGVFKMGGVGKSTIMNHINNQLVNETYNFDDVIWVTVSKAFNISKLQSELAITLDLDLSKYEDETRKASKLHNMLSQRKRYVLILDDLWEAFSLEKVGIPEPTRDNGCKLVLTTRLSEVCRRMECREIKVELLTKEETLNLFMTKVEEHGTVLAPKVKEIATKVAKECAQLPLAIITIAGSMKGVNDIHKWRNALNELISSTKEIWDDDSVVFERLKFSYSRLKDEKVQPCFLYCALYPEDHRIFREELTGYWIAEGLIVEMKSIEALFNKGHTILDKLINTCLLESPTNINDQGQYVSTHDLIREMSLKITSTNPRFMVQAGEGLVRVPYEDWSYDVERVSFMYNMIEELPSRPPICPCLITLLLKKNYSEVLLIPNSFFTHMQRLKVLDLPNSKIQSLPESISKLENLHTLLLTDCLTLKYMLSLKKLKALKELKLTKSLIEEVPQGIKELVNLRNLDLSWNYSLHMFPCRKLRRLTRLQCLRIKENKSISVSRRAVVLEAIKSSRGSISQCARAY